MGRPSQITSWGDSGSYLVDLKAAALLDLKPMLKSPGAGRHSVTREILRFADHLGHLYSGTSDVRGRLTAFLNDVMSLADAGYRRRSLEIYSMHWDISGQVLDARMLRNTRRQTLEWFTYIGPRHTTLQFPQFGPVNVRHLEPVPFAENRYWLPVSTPCLLDDLVHSIDALRTTVPQAERVAAWNRAVAEFPLILDFEFTP